MSAYLEFGIDLGTTNSCIARSDGMNTRIYPSSDRTDITASVVHVLKSGRLITGDRAYNATIEDPDNVAADFKRLMGHRVTKSFPASGRMMSPEELSAEVIKSLREDVRRETGEKVDAAVVTVPAAFGTLQCEATAKAARMAGIEQTHLLQEPIAAAIAYGATPGSRNQRWLVFDLGGGTLDVAVVSTREGRLAVLDHRGNNHLGGKDVDRQIVENFLLPALQDYDLPEPHSDKGRRLFRRLLRKAEQAKIDLSSSLQVVVSLIDLGEDSRGVSIETEVELNRTQLEGKLASLVEQCLRLVEDALSGARIPVSALDRVLLVGGPTRIPSLRVALSDRLGGKIDCSLDPMTVVARGAALFASTVENLSPRVGGSHGNGTHVVVQLAFEPVSATLEAMVAGRIASGATASELKIDADGGYWTSGWIPLTQGSFEVPVMLQEARTSRFWLYARDRAGNLLEVDPEGFGIRHGMVVAEPPLPHTISIEVVRPDGRTQLDPVFPRGRPLPAEAKVRYRADRTLRPSEPGTAIAIKVWEGEILQEPDANVWVGAMRIFSEPIHRPIPEGAEIQLTLQIDASRKITVDAFVPHLNQSFSDGVYLPETEQSDPQQQLQQVPRNIQALQDRLKKLTVQSADKEDRGMTENLDRLRREMEEIDISVNSREGLASDPDDAKRSVDLCRQIRGRIVALEQRAGEERAKTARAEDAKTAIAAIEGIAERFGSPVEKREFSTLRGDAERAAQRGDARGLRKIAEQLDALRWRILLHHDWFWRESFHAQQRPGRRFLNQTEAQRWLEFGSEALRKGNAENLREAVRRLWELQPKLESKVDQEKAMRAGLRKF